MKSNIVYEKEHLFAAIPTDGCTIFVSYKSSHTFTPDNEFSKKPIYIEMDNTGSLTTTCDKQIKDLTAGLEIQGKDIVRILDGTVDGLREVAISMKAGKIGMKVGVKDNLPVYTIIFTTNDIFPTLDTIDYEMTSEISFKIMPSVSGDGKQPKYEIDWEGALEVDPGETATLMLSLTFRTTECLLAIIAYLLSKKIIVSVSN